jgi:hypothetical protein
MTLSEDEIAYLDELQIVLNQLDEVDENGELTEEALDAQENILNCAIEDVQYLVAIVNRLRKLLDHGLQTVTVSEEMDCPCGRKECYVNEK